MGLSKVKRGCQIEKGKKKLQTKKEVSNSKNKTKKKIKLQDAHQSWIAMFCVWVVASVLVVVVCVVGRHCRARRRRSHRGSSLLAAVCRGVTRRCGVSWLVAGVAAGFRGRALCWSLEGSQLHSESLEGSCFYMYTSNP